MDIKLYDYSPTINRAPLHWPEGKKVAFYLGLNLEHYQIDKSSTSIFGGTAGHHPDPLNYGWRDYGLRVGLWRMIDSLDGHGIRASALVNAEVCRHYPQVVQAGLERDWTWVAHGALQGHAWTSRQLSAQVPIPAKLVGVHRPGRPAPEPAAFTPVGEALAECRNGSEQRETARPERRMEREDCMGQPQRISDIRRAERKGMFYG